MTPKRIQRKRTKGWRMPPNTIYVGRPSDWANNFTVAGYYAAGNKGSLPAARQAVVDIFTDGLHDYFCELVKHRLRGKNLACWCPLNEPCHADVLLRIANE